MNKLDDIEAYFASSINQAREPELQGEYEDWLIARVRTLETALLPLARVGDLLVDTPNVHHANIWTRSSNGPDGDTSLSVKDALAAREALKEED